MRRQRQLWPISFSLWIHMVMFLMVQGPITPTGGMFVEIFKSLTLPIALCSCYLFLCVWIVWMLVYILPAKFSTLKIYNYSFLSFFFFFFDKLHKNWVVFMIELISSPLLLVPFHYHFFYDELKTSRLKENCLLFLI